MEPNTNIIWPSTDVSSRSSAVVCVNRTELDDASSNNEEPGPESSSNNDITSYELQSYRRTDWKPLSKEEEKYASDEDYRTSDTLASEDDGTTITL